jgi:quercetin dioxygenase-like cupin family protein
MDTTEVATAWQHEGYLEVETQVRMPNVSRAPHAHPFDARGLIVAGELTLTWAGRPHTFRAGETFDMPAGCVHSEHWGLEATTVLVGRRYPSANR